MFKPNQVRQQKIYKYQQNSNNVLSILQSIKSIGAHTNPHNGLSVGELRRLSHSWPRDEFTNQVNLSWLVQLLLVQR